jgi:hypothetical protein
VFTALVVAYPVNVWLVDKGMKHGMGTVRALGEGGEPLPDQSQHRASAGEAAMTTAPTTVTRAQINAVAVLTIVLLAAGVLVAGTVGDFGA